jgi:hypothetical protein
MDTLNKKIEYKITLLCKYSANPKSAMHLLEKYFILYTDIIASHGKKEDIISMIVDAAILDQMEILAATFTKRDIIDEYNRVDIPMELEQVQINVCDNCGCVMDQSYDKTMLTCSVCNITRNIDNSMMECDKNQPRSKIGNFKFNRHFKSWMDHILARDADSEICTPNDLNGEILINTIKSRIKAKNISLAHITIDDIRSILKEIPMTNLNKNVSLIAKKVLGGKGPPQLSSASYQRVNAMFINVMEARESIVGNTRCNRIYYPYYICKIFDVLLIDPEERRAINYIHMHKPSTLANNDDEWYRICEIIDDLKGRYKPTLMDVRYL